MATAKRVQFETQTNTSHRSKSEDMPFSQNVVSTEEKRNSDSNRMSNRALIDTKSPSSFCRVINHTLGELNHHQSQDFSIPEEALRLRRKIEDASESLKKRDLHYHTDTVWEKVEALQNDLEETLNHVRSAIRELKQYMPVSQECDHLRTSSLESMDSYLSEKDAASAILKVSIQEGYNELENFFNEHVKLVGEGFLGAHIEVDATSLQAITCASHTISFLQQLVEFESGEHGYDSSQLPLFISEQKLTERRKLISRMFIAMCRHLMLLQETLFLREHLFAKGLPSVRKLISMAEILRKCWREADLVLKKMNRLSPEFGDLAIEHFGGVLFHAASMMVQMQDLRAIQDFLEHGIVIEYEPNAVRDITRAQRWLIPCVQLAGKLSSRILHRLKHRTKSNTPKSKPSPLIQDLKNVIYDLAMITIGRSSWLNSYPEEHRTSILKELLDQGARTLAFVSVYSQSYISLNCDQESTIEVTVLFSLPMVQCVTGQDVKHYSVMVCNTNILRNSVCKLHGLLQYSHLGKAEEPDVQEDDDLDESGNLKFHHIPGIYRLHTKISIKPFPVTFEEGSIEWAYGSNDQSVLETRISSEDAMASPWLGETDSFSDEISDSLRKDTFPNPPQPGTLMQASSGDSFVMSNAFKDIEVEPSAEVDSAFGQLPLPAKKENKGEFTLILPSSSTKPPSIRSPFEEARPKEPPKPHLGGWGCPPSSASEVETVTEPVSQESSSGMTKLVPAIELKNFDTSEYLGQGSEGTVLKMLHHETPVAVKIMKSFGMTSREKFKKETTLMSKLSPHPNIVNFVGQCKDLRGNSGNRTDLVMVLELCELGDLYRTISEAKWISQLDAIGKDLSTYKSFKGYLLYSEWERRIQIACDIASGAEHMHQNEIVHRDLTSYNIVLKEGDGGSWTAKICDFERSSPVPRGQTIPRSDRVANSPAWSAPEVLREEPYTLQADVFSFGVILWELWTLDEPWRAQDQDYRNQMLLIPMVGNGARLSIPSVEENHPFLGDLSNLIQSCWNDNPTQRPTMQEAHQALLRIKQKAKSQ